MSLYQNVFLVYYCMIIFDKLVNYYNKYFKKQNNSDTRIEKNMSQEEITSIEKNIKEMFEQQENKLTFKLEQLQKIVKDKEKK